MLNSKLQATLWVFMLLICERINAIPVEEPKDDLMTSESKDGTLEIIKQIKKVNDDGSYTVGYEADDGSFKIESRDVLGNVKGTYGYVDANGDVKRVSYSSNDKITEEEEESTVVPTSSVVQRIPKLNKTSETTKKPTIYSSPASTILKGFTQKRNNFYSTSTTEKTNFSTIGNLETKSTTKAPHIVYATSVSPIRSTLQSRSLLRSSSTTTSSPSQATRLEGQLLKPESITLKPTEIPLFKRLAFKHSDSLSKPVTEEPVEIKSNILRRELSNDRNLEHFYMSHRHSLGGDSSDVYSASVSTDTPRPLFTTTNRPRSASLVTLSSTAIPRTTSQYSNNHQKNPTQETQANSPEYAQESTNEAVESTPTPIPVAQIPANRGSPETLVALRHPYQRGTILIPLSQLRNQFLPFESPRDINDNIQGHVVQQQQQYGRETSPRNYDGSDAQRPLLLRRLPPPQLRPMPVQVDENGYIREVPQQQVQRYQLPIPIQQQQFRSINNDVSNDIENILPPVSTQDFQRLLQILISRQSRLERLHDLTDPRRHPELLSQRYRQPLYPPPEPQGLYVQRLPEGQQNGPVQFLPTTEPSRQNQFIRIPQDRQYLSRASPNLYDQRDKQYEQDQYEAQSYVPTKRVARLLKSQTENPDENTQDYLPPEVREMLLLKMLQLAINPALPVESPDHLEEESSTAVPKFKKAPVRNVEILGEDPIEVGKDNSRIKRADDLEINE